MSSAEYGGPQQPEEETEPEDTEASIDARFRSILSATALEADVVVSIDRTMEDIARDEHIADQFHASQWRSETRRKRQGLIPKFLGRVIGRNSDH